jgi:hypothetical protein
MLRGLQREVCLAHAASQVPDCDQLRPLRVPEPKLIFREVCGRSKNPEFLRALGEAAKVGLKLVDFVFAFDGLMT